jgi:hypothetical protein
VTVEEAVRARILDLAAVTALVSTRVYMLKLPQQPTLPAVRVQLVADNVEQQLRGPDGIRRGRVQVDIYAAEAAGSPYASVTAVADALDGDGLGTNASGLFGWIGDIGSPALEVLNVRYAAPRRAWYESEEKRQVRMMLDYYVEYRSG